jgi:hypothetical protein
MPSTIVEWLVLVALVVFVVLTVACIVGVGYLVYYLAGSPAFQAWLGY